MNASQVFAAAISENEIGPDEATEAMVQILGKWLRYRWQDDEATAEAWADLCYRISKAAELQEAH